MSEDFSHYKLLQKKIEDLEQDCVKCRAEFEALTMGHKANRMDIDKMILALFGDDEIGILGILERFRMIEDNIMRGRQLQFMALALSVILSASILMFLFIRFGV